MSWWYVQCTVFWLYVYSFIRLFLQPLGVLFGVAPDLITVQALPLISPPGGGAYVAELQVSRSAYVAELQVSLRSVRLGVGEELRGSSIGCVDHRESVMFPFQCVCCYMSMF